MKSSRPYLVRALYEWLVANEQTPYLLVDATYPGVRVPKEHVNNGNIVLNMAPLAIDKLLMGNREITFSARFSRGHFDLFIPIPAVLAIYGSETGKGMFFSDEDLGDEFDAPSLVLEKNDDSKNDDDDDGGDDNGGGSGKGKPFLTLVKN